ncbi:O-antigen ligase family protein [Nitrobacter sp.]|uniref:O-antigen ligase family protein n=1 Tax=Nitrobacter sp. TaxID=29420 RepID=UPI00321F6F1D
MPFAVRGSRLERIAKRAPHRIGGFQPSVAPEAATAQPVRRLKPSILIPIFVFTLASPVLFYIGTVRLSPYRLVLIATFIPCLIAWLSGSVGRIRLPDIFMLSTAAWGAIVLLSHHGIDGLQSAGIFIIETFGSFLFARRYIRDITAFQNMVKYLTLMVIFLLPFAIYENVSGSPILIQLFGSVFSVYDVVGSEARFGLRRAQGTFEHFILFGVVCSTAFALSFYVLRSSLLSRLSPGFVAIAVVSSLSSGAILSVVVQAMLIGWDKVTAAVTRRWAILATIVLTAYFFVDVMSNRSPIDVFISYLTFNADTSYMRVHIWNYGTQSVMNNPILGVGMNDWKRPFWMGGSIDNFWLGTAVTYGIPGLLLMIGNFLSVCFGLGRLKNLQFHAAQCRKGLIITICGVILAVCTVHVWDAPYVLVLFLLGSAMWMFDDRVRDAPEPSRNHVSRPPRRGINRQI